MSTFLRTILLIGFSLCFTQFATAVQFGYRLGGELNQRLYIENHFFNEETLNFDKDDLYNILIFSPDLFVTYGKSIYGYVLADVGGMFSKESEPSSEVRAEWINAYVNYSGKRIDARAGLQPFRVGKGMIIDSDEPGINVDFSLSKTLYINANVARVIDISPFSSVTLGYRPGFLEKIEIFGALFNDLDNAVAEWFNQIFYYNNSWITPIDITASHGNLIWYGICSDLFLGPFYFSATAIRQIGNITLSGELTEKNMHVSSYLLDAGLSYNLTEELTSTLFLFISSGDKYPTHGDLTTFLSPMPYNTRTAIFLNDGIGMQGAKDRLSLGGITLAGVVSPGLILEYQPKDQFTAEMLLAIHFPEKKLSETQNWYGWETSIFLTYFFFKNQRVFIKTDWFEHGNFFKTSDGERPKPVQRFTIGYSLYF